MTKLGKTAYECQRNSNLVKIKKKTVTLISPILVLELAPKKQEKNISTVGKNIFLSLPLHNQSTHNFYLF